MKTILLIAIAFFTLSTINAQSVAENTSNQDVDVHTTKVEFFKALVEKNNLDIEIEDYKVTTTTKEDFYNLLLEKNGFDTVIRASKRTQVAYDDKEVSKEIKNTSKALGGLMP